MLGGIDLSIQAMASLASVIVALTIDRLGYGSLRAGGRRRRAGRALSAASPMSSCTSRPSSPRWRSAACWPAPPWSSRRRALDHAGRSRARLLAWVTGTAVRHPARDLHRRRSCCSVAHIVQSRTRFGRYSAAIGAGEAAAYASGVKVDRQKILAFVLSGAFAGLAGVILAGRLASGSPTLANELLLPAIAAVVVGGTAITGGVGSIWRTLIGALIISVVRIGMTFVGVNIFAQQIVFGVVLILAVAITIDRSKIPIVK